MTNWNYLADIQPIKYLGKIEKVTLGVGGYQDAMFGFTFYFSFDGSSICDFRGVWNSDPASTANLSIQQRSAIAAKCFEDFREIMNLAKAKEFSELHGKPVEITLEDRKLKSWRILEEVL